MEFLLKCWEIPFIREGVEGAFQGCRQGCWPPSEGESCTIQKPRANQVQAGQRHGSQLNFHYLLTAHLLCRARPSFSFPCFWSEKWTAQRGLQLMSFPSYLMLLEEFLAKKGPNTPHTVSLFSFSCSFTPFLWLRNLSPLVRQGWAFWIVFICWHSGVKAFPVNCILILSAVCICFSSTSLPYLIYDFPSPCLLLSQRQADSVVGVWAADRNKTCFYKVICRVIQNPAICVVGLNVDQAFSDWLYTTQPRMYWCPPMCELLCVSAISKEGGGGEEELRDSDPASSEEDIWSNSQAK